MSEQSTTNPASTSASVPTPAPESTPTTTEKEDTSYNTSTPAPPEMSEKRKPPAILVIGMAGSGKTTLMQRLNADVRQNKKVPYTLNLDPAVHSIPYPANIDIRDTVNYKEVMKQYQLGPNGGILTSLNLFATRFDKVIEFIDNRADQVDYVLCDTPGQIEIFTWSASGSVITECLATSLPTTIVYVIDTARCVNPITFMSNMLYACSILYKTRLPMVIAFNKSDIVDPEFAIEWMTDFEALQEAVDKDPTFMSSLARSMSLVLEEFYRNMSFAKVSAVTGSGMDDLFERIDEAVDEYYEVYLPEVERIKEKKREKEEAKKKEEIEEQAKNFGQNAYVYRGGKEQHPEEESDDDLAEDAQDETEAAEILQNQSFQRFLANQRNE